MPKATTVRFTDEMFARLDQASARTGMPVNSIVIAACLEWMSRHAPEQARPADQFVPPHPPPRWATIRRAVKLASTKHGRPVYPFERFTATAEAMLTASQAEADKSGMHYIGTEHLLLACFADPVSQAARALHWLEVSEQEVRKRLEELIGRERRTVAQRMVPTSRVKKVVELAFKFCGSAHEPRVSTGHLLLALSAEGEGIAARVLRELGAPVERIESALDVIRDPEP